jgi:glycosyltransferase involved in cell wall biosynthesis
MSAWTIMRQDLPLEEYDALVVLSEGLGDLVVFRNHSVPVINICLTPLRIVFDPVYQQRHLEKRGLLYRMAISAGSKFYSWLDRRAWAHYKRVICISQECLDRVRAGGLGDSRNQDVRHVGLGFMPPAPADVFEPYFLVPGRVMWTKNIELAINAFKEFRGRRPEFAQFRLVVAGIVDKKSEEYLQRLRDLAGEDAQIEFRVFPSDSELETLYRRCYGVLFTAFNEDWGIVPLEGMAFGKPVIAVNRGGPRESVQHERTGFLEEPEPAAFAARMEQLAQDPKLARSMGQTGHQYARRFTWSSFAGHVDDELERLVSGPGRVRQETALEPAAATISNAMQPVEQSGSLERDR